jgi:HNH endonuclease
MLRGMRGMRQRRLPTRVVVEIGQRDNWLCGICRDPSQPMTRRPAAAGAMAITSIDLDDIDVVEPLAPPPEWIPEEKYYDPLAASVDHIVPQKDGGSDDPSNLQIAHLYCNLMKARAASPTPEYAAARLRWRV